MPDFKFDASVSITIVVRADSLDEAVDVLSENLGPIDVQWPDVIPEVVHVGHGGLEWTEANLVSVRSENVGEECYAEEYDVSCALCGDNLFLNQGGMWRDDENLSFCPAQPTDDPNSTCLHVPLRTEDNADFLDALGASCASEEKQQKDNKS